MLKLPSWDETSDYHFTKSDDRRSTLRLVLKTKNEPLLLEKWIRHHAAIVGMHNLVILDNQSDDREVLRVYEKYRRTVSIFRFTEFYDLIHDTGEFPKLHAALRESSDYYAILDTDEFLYYYDGHRFCADARLTGAMADLKPQRSVPTVWLYTAAGYERRPMCSGKQSFVDGLKWGKTIFRSAAGLTGLVSHNCQVPFSELAQPTPAGGFFLFHLTLLSPTQRIRANRAKLVASGFAGPAETLDDVLQKDPDSTNMYILQIRHLLGAPEPQTSDDDPIAPGVIKLLDDGSAVFASAAEAAGFARLVADFPAICAATFAPTAQGGEPA